MKNKTTCLDELSLQEIYEIVRDHLLTQDAASIKSGQCRYRGLSGKMCAIGCLIPDNKYDPRMDVDSWSSHFEGDIDNVLKVIFGNPSIKLKKLCKELQEVHDFSSPRDWAEGLLVVAEKYGLRP